MKIANAIRKLEKNGYTIKDGVNREYYANKGKKQINFFDQDNEVICIDTGHMGNGYVPNISMAIRINE